MYFFYRKKQRNNKNKIIHVRKTLILFTLNNINIISSAVKTTFHPSRYCKRDRSKEVISITIYNIIYFVNSFLFFFE